MLFLTFLHYKKVHSENFPLTYESYLFWLILIISADYSSTSTSSDYSSDSEDSWEDDSILVEDNKAEVRVVKAQLNPRANRMDDPQFNPNIKVSITLNYIYIFI